jgi:hypothetical protein
MECWTNGDGYWNGIIGMLNIKHSMLLTYLSLGNVVVTRIRFLCVGCGCDSSTKCQLQTRTPSLHCVSLHVWCLRVVYLSMCYGCDSSKYCMPEERVMQRQKTWAVKSSE